MPTLWVYKLTYDSGCAPHVQDGLLSLALCKPEIRKRSVEGDWLFGFGGRTRAVIRGERLIYVARVTKKLTRPGEYYDNPEYRQRWDCVYERRNGLLVSRPGAVFHPDNTCVDRDLGDGPLHAKAVVLLSDDFRYLGGAGTMDYVPRWPDLGTYVHELGIGQRQVDPESRIGRMLVELQREIWNTCDFAGDPTEPSEPPPWDSDDDGPPPPPLPTTARPRGGCGAGRAAGPPVRDSAVAPAAAKRERLLELAESIKRPIIRELGGWIGGLELELATAFGTTVVNVQDGSSGDVDGPFTIPERLHREITFALGKGSTAQDACRQFEDAWNAHTEHGDVDFGDVVAMVREGAKPDVEYYKLQGGEGPPVFGLDPEQLKQDWVSGIADAWGTDGEPWSEMADDELEEKLAEFGLTLDDEG